VDVQHRGLDRVTVHHRLAGHAADPALQQRDVGAGAAHVEGDQVGIPGQPPHRLRADHAGGGAGQHGAHRQPRRLLETDHPTVGLRQMWRCGHAKLREAAREALDIAAHHRA
jgi:hypothetical protein